MLRPLPRRRHVRTSACGGGHGPDSNAKVILGGKTDEFSSTTNHWWLFQNYPDLRPGRPRLPGPPSRLLVAGHRGRGPQAEVGPVTVTCARQGKSPCLIRAARRLCKA